MSGHNGQKKWLIGVLTAIMLGLAGWAGSTVTNNSAKIANIEGEHRVLLQWMEQVNHQLDRIERKLGR